MKRCLVAEEKRIEAQHKKGKLTARERIERLLDPVLSENWIDT